MVNTPAILKKIGSLLKEIFAEWGKDKAWQLAAALAFYTIFSLTPILIIAVAIAGMIFGEAAARQEIIIQVQNLIGQYGAQAVGSVLENIADPSATLTASIVGFAMLLLGASGFFWQLQIAMNTIWKTEPGAVSLKHNILMKTKTRLIAFGLALATGILLIASLIISTFLSAAGEILIQFIPGPIPFWFFLNQAVLLLMFTLLFTALFKYVPDALIRWRDALFGGLFTSALFSLGNLLIGLYLGRTSIASAYGAAGSFIIFLLWIYYSAQIFLLGAEFTLVYSRKTGHPIRPAMK